MTRAHVWPPGGLTALQFNAAGSMLLVDRSARVVGPTGDGFKQIGSVEQVMRYGLRQLLEGRCWSDAYQRRHDLTAYDLAAIDFSAE